MGGQGSYIQKEKMPAAQGFRRKESREKRIQPTGHHQFGDLSNDMTWRQMIAVGVRRLVRARGELDRLEGPGYAARRAELRRAARARERQAAAPSQDEAEESDATEEEATRERTTRVGRQRGGMHTNV